MLKSPSVLLAAFALIGAPLHAPPSEGIAAR